MRHKLFPEEMKGINGNCGRSYIKLYNFSVSPKLYKPNFYEFSKWNELALW